MKLEDPNNPMLTGVSVWVLLTGLLAAFCFATHYSLPLQSPTLIGLSLVGIYAALAARKATGIAPPRLTIFVVICAAYFLVRSVISPVVDLAREDIFLILAAMLMYVCLVDVLGYRQTRMQLAYVVLIGLCLHLGSAVYQFEGGEGFRPISLFTNADRANPDGITGMYGYRGSFANYAAIASMLALSLGIWGRFWKWFRCVLCLLALVSMAAVFISHSRSAALSVAVGIAVMLCLLWISVANQSSKIRSRVRAGIAILGGAGMLVAIVGGYYVFFQRGLGAGVDVLFSDGARPGYWPMALEQFYDHPILGAGSRSFSYELHQYWNPNLRLGSPNPEFVHNEYLQLAADYGMVGLILAISIVGIHIVCGFVSVAKWSHDKRISISQGSNMVALGIAGVVGIVIMAVHMCFDFRTHVLANLLLLVCCLVWAIPLYTTSDRNEKWVSSAVMRVSIKVVVLLCSILGLYMGSVELRGGLPLMKIKATTETGSWKPSSVDRKMMIPSLEESVESAPSFRRYLKLGTLYRLEAGTSEITPQKAESLLKQSLESYLKAEQRHPFDPVIQVNLGSAHAALGEYEEADKHFSESIHISGARGDRWFGIRWKWADTKHRHALKVWKKGRLKDAERYFAESMKLLYQSNQRFDNWQTTYQKALANYLYFLSKSNSYDIADALIKEAQKNLSPHIRNRLNLVLAKYYFRKGKYYWYSRRASKAHKLLTLSRGYYLREKRRNKGKVGDAWKDEYNEVVEILRFLKKTNITPTP